MSEIVSLKEARGPEADPDIVASLERLLEKAKTGEIRSLAYIVELTQHSIGTGYCGTDLNAFALVGGCEEIKLRLLERYDVKELADILTLE